MAKWDGEVVVKVARGGAGEGRGGSEWLRVSFHRRRTATSRASSPVNGSDGSHSRIKHTEARPESDPLAG